MKRRLDWGGWLAIGVAVYALSYAIWTASGWSLGSYSSFIDDVADYPAMIAAAVLMVRASRAVEAKHVRRGWLLLATGLVALIIANAIYDYISIVLHKPTFPSLGDVFFLAFFPCSLVGLLSLPEKLGTPNEKITFALDAATLMVGGGMLILRFAILPVAGTHTTTEVVLASYYPLADMVMAIGVAAILFRKLSSTTRTPLYVLSAAFVVLFISDLVYSHDTLANTYVGVRFTDSLWTVAYSVMAIAAQLQYRSAKSVATFAPPRRQLSSWLPNVAVAACLGVLIVEARQNWDSSLGTEAIAVALLLALVGARQIVVVRENTRIAAENADSANEARFIALVQQASDVITVVDRDRIVHYVSPSAERVLGFGVDELDGQRFSDHVHPEDVAIAGEFFDKLLLVEGGKVTASWRQRHRSGRWLHVDVVGSNAMDEPTVRGLVLNTHDVSERVELEQAREVYQTQLMHSQKMDALGRLAGGVAHDMNNALATIIATADCMGEDELRPEARGDLDAIMLAASRAAELTRNLLGFARQGEYRQEVLRPESLITAVVGMLARTLPKGIKVETSFGADLAAIEGDPTQLHHAIVNLCINASDAMSGHGVLTIGAQLEHDRVVLRVKDTGCGMDEATRQRVFEPFFTTKEPGQGTGLGLAMVYATVKRHRGEVEVESAPGQGATFRIFLPVSAAVPEIAKPPRVRLSVPVPIASAGRVLIVDDEPLLRSVTQRLLERRGFDVTVAAHGQEGLEQLRRHQGKFDVVLLDMAMPIMAGPEMFRRARAEYPDLRILLVSGFSSPEDVRALLDAGACGLVTKPFAPALLLDAISVVKRGQRIDAVDAGLAAYG